MKPERGGGYKNITTDFFSKICNSYHAGMPQNTIVSIITVLYFFYECFPGVWAYYYFNRAHYYLSIVVAY